MYGRKYTANIKTLTAVGAGPQEISRNLAVPIVIAHSLLTLISVLHYLNYDERVL